MNFILRPWQLADIENLVKYANNWEIAKFMNDQFPFPYTEAHASTFIQMANKKQPTPIFAIDVHGAAIGGIGIHPQTDIYHKNAELGYWLAEPFWGQKIISNAIKQIINFGFQKFPIERIYARPFGSNKASQKVLEKNHFVLESTLKNTFFKQNEYHDELIYAIWKKDWKTRQLMVNG